MLSVGTASPELELAMLNHSEMKLLLELAGLSTREVMLMSKAHKTVSHAVREKRNTSSRTLAYWEHYFNGLQFVSGSQEQTSEVTEAGLVGSHGAPLNLDKWRAPKCSTAFPNWTKGYDGKETRFPDYVTDLQNWMDLVGEHEVLEGTKEDPDALRWFRSLMRMSVQGHHNAHTWTDRPVVEEDGSSRPPGGLQILERMRGRYSEERIRRVIVSDSLLKLEDLRAKPRESIMDLVGRIERLMSEIERHGTPQDLPSSESIKLFLFRAVDGQKYRNVLEQYQGISGVRIPFDLQGAGARLTAVEEASALLTRGGGGGRVSGKTTNHVADFPPTTTDEESTADGRAIVLALENGAGGPQSPFPRGAVPLDRTKYQQYDADLTAVFALAALEAQRLADEYWPEGEKYPANYESNGGPGSRNSANHRKGGKKSGCGGGTAPNSERTAPNSKRAQANRAASQEDDACDEDVDYADDADYVSHRLEHSPGSESWDHFSPDVHDRVYEEQVSLDDPEPEVTTSTKLDDPQPEVTTSTNDVPAAKAFGNEYSSDSDGDGPGDGGDGGDEGDGGDDDDAGVGDGPPPEPPPDPDQLGSGEELESRGQLREERETRRLERESVDKQNSATRSQLFSKEAFCRLRRHLDRAITSLTDSPCCDVLQDIAREFADKQDGLPVHLAVRLIQVEVRLAKRRWEHSRAALQEARAAELRVTRAAESRWRWLERGAEAAEKHAAVVEEPGNYLGVAPAVVIHGQKRVERMQPRLADKEAGASVPTHKTPTIMRNKVPPQMKSFRAYTYTNIYLYLYRN